MIMSKEIEIILTSIAQGNPGCLDMLVTTMKSNPAEFVIVAETLIKAQIFGSRAYMLWNDACNRSHDEFIRLILAIRDGSLPLTVVEEHLSRGWCRPFDLEKEISIDKEAKSSYMDEAAERFEASARETWNLGRKEYE